MISVVVYGRNDSHGYNAHRRVALSLNCIAEVLTDTDDEIVFVDYNTADGLPTLIEAIADTLTGRCLSSLRVLRVRAAVHERRYGASTHLEIAEPVARNVGARRSNAKNRWLLQTTTDMVFVPRSDRSLSEVCADLPDGYYCLPRYELPEWLWEQIPRSDPAQAITEISSLGPALHLDETTLSHEEMRFDAPGDFQLVLRDEFFAIDGFDEEMLLGWHVDSNLSKRLYLRRGSVETLEHEVAGYHCNHLRTRTVYHDTPTQNDMGRFFHDVVRPELPAQRGTWGLAGEDVEEVPLERRAGLEFTNAALDASGSEDGDPPWSSDSTREWISLEYDSRHVLPFVLDEVRSAPRDARVAYVGANPDLERRLAAFLASWNGGELMTPQRDGADAGADAADILVIDLGIDRKRFDTPLAEGSGGELTRARAQLVGVYEMLGQLVLRERARTDFCHGPRRFVLVNSAAGFWNAYVVANLDVSAATPHSRVRRGVVRPSAIERLDTARAERLVNWLARDDSGAGLLRLDSPVTRVGDLEEYSGFRAGWWFPDGGGIWTRDGRSELALGLRPGIVRDGTLVLVFDGPRVAPPSELVVSMEINGTRVDVRTFSSAAAVGNGSTHPHARRTVGRNTLSTLARRARTMGVPGIGRTIAAARRLGGHRPPSSGRFRWDVQLDEDVCTAGKLDVTLSVENDVAWADDRRLGLYLRAIEIRPSTA